MYEQRVQSKKKPPVHAAPIARTPVASRAQSTGNDPVFLFKDAVITGASSIPLDVLVQVYQPYRGKEIPISTLVAMTEQINAIYHERGYALSRAIIPAQDLSSGNVTIQVIEGYVGEVRFTGPGAEKLDLSRYAAPITQERPVRLITMERQLLLLTRLTGLTVGRPQLEEAGELTGHYVMTVHLGFSPFGLAVTTDNGGSRDVGRVQSWARGTLNAPLGQPAVLGASLASVPASPREWTYGEVSYDHALLPELFFGGSISGAELNPDGEDRLIKTRTRNFSAQLRGSYIAMLDRDTELRFSSSFAYYDSEETNIGGLYSRDRTWAVSVGAQYFTVLPGDGWVIATAGFQQGLNIFGASKPNRIVLSNVDGSPRFSKGTGSITWEQPLPASFSLAVGAIGQISASPLLSSDEFYLGGTGFGRAYEPGTLSGDAGFAASAELRYGKEPNWQYLKKWQVYGFYDGGAVWERGFADSRTSLASAGAGVRLSFPYDIELSLETAFPLTYSEPGKYEDHNPRFNFAISKTF